MDLNQNQSHIFMLAEEFFFNDPSEEQCTNGITTTVFCIVIEIGMLVIISQFLHTILKRFYQPSTVSQMLAGLFLSPTIAGGLLTNEKNQLEFIASTGRIFFMFLVGLEMDRSYLKHTIRAAGVIVAGGLIACATASTVAGTVLHHLIHSDAPLFFFCVAVFLIFFNTASPILIRVVSELKLTMTDTGRVAISAALVTDIFCLTVLGVLGFSNLEIRKHGAKDWTTRMGSVAMLGVVIVIAALIVRFTVNVVNKRNRHKRVVTEDVMFYILLIVFAVSLAIEFIGFDPMMPAFFLGLLIPRDGPTSRTLIEQLTSSVYNVVLPIYFGVAALQVNLGMLMYKEVILTTLAVIVVGTAVKVGGTIAAAKYLGMQLHEALVLSFLLNIKGHVNLVIITLGKKYEIWDDKIHMALLIALFVNSITACRATTFIVCRERRTIRGPFEALESLDSNSELRILACALTPGDLPTILDLIDISSGNNRNRLAPHILYLTELTGMAATTMLHHQLHDMDSESSDQGQVTSSVDTFVRETKINVRLLNGVSHFDSMHLDMRNAAEDMRASLAIVPFHRKLRFDGKMGKGKENVRQFNANALRDAPCSLGILVDRGLGKEQRAASDSNSTAHSLSSTEGRILNVVALFLGGPDDREAVAYAGRLASHPCVNLTVLRFLPSSGHDNAAYPRASSATSSASSTVAIDCHASDENEIFMSNYYQRYVVTGMVTYVERMVESSQEIITVLSTMEGMYSLYIVGREVRGPAARLTLGLSDWEECPELGSVGDLLATSDFMSDGSVLVIQQYNEAATPAVA